MNAVAERVEASFAALREHAEKIKNDEHQTVATMSPGDAWAQGDLLLVCLEKLPEGVAKVESPALQLAPGETQGSRHCLEALDGITVWRRTEDDFDWVNPLDGPILEAPNGLRVNHPEHGDVSLPAGLYGVVYQRAHAEELRRVED